MCSSVSSINITVAITQAIIISIHTLAFPSKGVQTLAPLGHKPLGQKHLQKRAC